MDGIQRSPFYLRLGVTLITLALLALGLYLGKGILLPVFFSILLATLLLPAVNFLQRKRVGKILSISITLIITMMILGGVVYFLATQIGNFLEDIPVLMKRSKLLIWELQKWVNEQWNIGFGAQKEYIEETTDKMNAPQVVGKTVLSITTVLSYAVFLPTYTFLILYHKDMIKRFLINITYGDSEEQVRDLLQESQLMSQQYITGLLLELCIVFTLNSIGFLLIGIKYPIFIAMVGALLNLVPYIGMIIANLIGVFITLMAMKDPSNALWVAGVFTSVQLLDNNVLMPMIVGNKVKLNALAIIIGVLIAGSLCGIGGMFLAIPGLAVLKLIFERVDHLKPWAMLLGDETTIEAEKKHPVKRIFNRMSKKASDKKRNPVVR